MPSIIGKSKSKTPHFLEPNVEFSDNIPSTSDFTKSSYTCPDGWNLDPTVIMTWITQPTPSKIVLRILSVVSDTTKSTYLRRLAWFTFFEAVLDSGAFDSNSLDTKTIITHLIPSSLGVNFACPVDAVQDSETGSTAS
jgi:hypothetical protein